MPPLELFAPNNHSAFQISFRPTEPAFRANLASGLLERYPFASVAEERIMQVNEAEQMSNNFRVEAVTEDGHPLVLLVRKNILLSKEEEVAFMEKTLTFLHERNIPVPTFVEARDGKFHCAFDGSLWQVSLFIDGNHYSGEPDELVSAAKEFAKLHTVLLDFPYEKELQEKMRPRPPFSTERLERVLAAALRNENELDAILLDAASFLREMAGECARIRDGNVRTQIVHGDLHPHNTIFADGKLRALFDFDLMKHTELLREVGFASHRFARQYAVRRQGGLSAAVEGIQKFLAAYRVENPLTDEEVTRLPAFMMDELLRRIVSDFSGYYFEGTTRFANVQELTKKLTLLQEAKELSPYVT